MQMIPTYKHKIALLIYFSVAASVFCLQGQDLHYTQFYNSPLNINPALTGVYNGDQRVIGSLRDQWRSVPVPWFTFSGSYDQKHYLKNHDEGFMGWGAIVNHDRQGDSRLNLTSISGTASYTRILAPEHLLTGGLLLGFASRGFDLESLTWDSQWDGQDFDPSRATGEGFNAERVNYLETGLGINYRFQRSARTHLNVGVGVFHVYEPTTTFYDTDNQKLPRHYSLTAVGNFELADAVDIQLHAMHQIQDVYDETVVGLLGKFYISQQRGNEWRLDLGGSYRTSGAIAPTIAMSWNQWYVGFSYDIDISDFDQYTNGRGGPELHVRYIITHVKDLDKTKVCPIY
jgi:type IX secretion system PorP/SprF family membrane protein